MKIKRMLIGALLAGILALAPSAYAISLSVSSDAGGFTENINAGVGDSVYGSTVIGSDSLSNSIKGSGDFSEDHWISNKEGDTAGVGVDIRKAKYYNYDYYLAVSPYRVWAAEDVDVKDAYYINAWANSFNAQGNNAGVSTVLFDLENRVSLSGYSNRATASANDAYAAQSAEGAFAPYGSILTESSSQNQFTISPDDLSMEKSDAYTTVRYGSIKDYFDSASASSNLVEAQQSGHIAGTFDSTAKAGSASKTRTSNYGTEYDIDMLARMDDSGSYASGTLGYYVDINNPGANRIQGAVNASESGDAVNVASGTYYENVQIDKSLNVLGAGASNTIVDGQQAGSVFTIGKKDPSINVALSGMTIRGGSDSGIKNFGTMKLTDSTISGNSAENGGGINSNGEVALDGVSIIKNDAKSGGGIYNSGTVTMNGGSIAGNKAEYGGGIFSDGLVGSATEDNGYRIFNHGTVTMNGGSIVGNRAEYGGGIANLFGGSLNLDGGSISGNTAQNGGGIYNYCHGKVTMNGGGIAWNNAENGSGIYNDFSSTVNLNGGDIVGNSASYGGGIYSDYSSTVNLNGGDIIGNIASYGGGIYSNGGTVNLNAGSISYNKALVDGGGIYDYYGTITGNRDLVKYNIPNDIVSPKFIPTDPPVRDWFGQARLWGSISTMSPHGSGVQQTPASSL